MQIALGQKGIMRSYSTAKRAMQQGNLVHESNRSPDKLIKADKKAQRPGNLIARDFSVELPNQKWMTDITEVHCMDAKLYIASIMDCFGGEIISCAVDTNMKKQLCTKAVTEAWKNRNPKGGLICLSDAGSRYTSKACRKVIGQLHNFQSMSDVGKCYDNEGNEHSY